MVKEGRFPRVGDGHNKRSMGYIDNLSQGILRAAIAPEASGEIFWIADRSPYAMVEIINTVRTVLKDDFSIPVKDGTFAIPGIVASLARAMDATLQAVGLYHQKIHVLSEMNLTIACSIAKAQRVLSYEPQIELREGMRRSIEWCLAANQKI
jgi:nucleoside-diphosphate-sugar epimerase